MNARCTAVVAGDPEPGKAWAEAGDQLYVDFDISEANLPAGTRIAIGAAVLEVTALPHTGCGKFIRRFGIDAQKFVNTPGGRALRLRGVNTRVVSTGEVSVGDSVRKA
jgi:MOSC domain-containing protein YiiM